MAVVGRSREAVAAAYRRDDRLKKIFGWNTTTPIPQRLVDTPGEVYAFHENIDGEFYVVVWMPNDKTRIYKLIEQTGGSPSTFPQHLSDVPCVDPAGARRLSPGSVEESIISVRVNSVGAERMPPIGKNVVDPVGSVLLEEWILSLTACP